MALVDSTCRFPSYKFFSLQLISGYMVVELRDALSVLALADRALAHHCCFLSNVRHIPVW